MSRRAGWLGALALVACAPPLATPAAPRMIVTPAPVGAPTPLPAGESEESPEADEDDETLRPCTPGTAEHQAAESELANISLAVDALPMVGDPAPIGERIAKMLEGKCFMGQGEDLALDKLESAMSLKTFWRDGGHSALDAPLQWGRDKDRYYWYAASPRTALTKENAASHPLASLLCPGSMGPSTCGQETAGWAHRAALAMRAAARKPEKTHEDCTKVALEASKSNQFSKFLECMPQTADREDQLPIGNFQAPTTGWLVLRGRRGHHAWCEELRAYDLATGAAYIASLCGGMFAHSGPAAIKIERGKLPLDALREAAWMMFFSNAADHNVAVGGMGRSIPKELDIRLPAHWGFGIGGLSMSFSSGRTTLVWQWVKGSKSLATGTTSWPDADGGAEEHATNLLAVAELAMKPGCAPAAVPTSIPWGARSDEATRVDKRERYIPKYDEPEYADLERELSHATRGCP